jgi:ATPase subunit of ABC transporter with duplicated ATPase domains
VREYAGGWSDFVAARAVALERQYDAFARSQERTQEVRALLNERRGQARTGGAMANRRGTHALMTKVRQAARALERVEQVDKPYEPWELHLSLAAAQRPGDRVASLEGAVAERSDPSGIFAHSGSASADPESAPTERQGSFRLGPLDLDLAPGERVAVTGRNGSGKSTLLALLLGELPLAAGTRDIGRTTAIGALDQRRTTYAGDEPLLSTLTLRTSLRPVDARTLLAKFNLGPDHVERPCTTLSPGERTRAELAELMARGVNLLVLDEPTNHLDLEAIEELETALAAYDGTLVVVSHDRRFLEAVAPTRSIEL